MFQKIFTDVCGNPVKPELTIGDVIIINGKTYHIDDFISGGATGQVFKVSYEKRISILKISIGSFGYDQVKNEINKYKYLRDKAVSEDEKKMFLNIFDAAIYENQMRSIFIAELMTCNLLDLMTDRNSGFTLNYVQYIGRSLVKQLKFIHKNHLIHTDIKPENIMIKNENNRTIIKLVDFGGMIPNSQDTTNNFYIQTLFYRAPEVILRLDYDDKIDIWSLGATLAEIYTGLPIFAGNDDTSLLLLMERRFGKFPESIVNGLKEKNKYFNKDGNVISASNNFVDIYEDNYCTLQHIIKSIEEGGQHTSSNDRFLDLLKGMLEIDKSKRFSIDDVLSHDFFQSNVYN